MLRFNKYIVWLMLILAGDVFAKMIPVKRFDVVECLLELHPFEAEPLPDAIIVDLIDDDENNGDEFTADNSEEDQPYNDGDVNEPNDNDGASDEDYTDDSADEGYDTPEIVYSAFGDGQTAINSVNREVVSPSLPGSPRLLIPPVPGRSYARDAVSLSPLARLSTGQLMRHAVHAEMQNPTPSTTTVDINSLENAVEHTN